MAWKRHLSRSIFLAVLAAVGYGIHLLLPPAPRWELQGPFEALGLTSDSRHFWTIGIDPKGLVNGGKRGPLQLRDLSSGDIVREFLESGSDVFHIEMAPTGRFVVIWSRDPNCVRLIDAVSKTETMIALDAKVKELLQTPNHAANLNPVIFLFSPNESYVRFRAGNPVVWSCLIETATATIKKRYGKGEYVNNFLLDGSYALVTGIRGQSALWNIDKDQNETHRLGESHESVTFTHISSDSRRVITFKDDSHSEASVWDAATWRNVVVRHPRGGLSFSSGGRWLMDTEWIHGHTQCRVAIHDAATGKRMGEFESAGGPPKDVLKVELNLSRDESMGTVESLLPTGSRVFEMMQLPGCKRLWTRPRNPTTNPWASHFFTAGGSLVVVGEGVELWDAQTGATKAEIWSPQRMSGKFNQLTSASLSKDAKVVWGTVYRSGSAGWWDEWLAARWPWMVASGFAFVADASNGALLLEAPFTSEFNLETWLSDDGRSLVVSQTDKDTITYTHRAYDIPARPRWGWVIGVPAGLCGTVLSLRQLRRRSKSKTTKPQAPGAATSS